MWIIITYLTVAILSVFIFNLGLRVLQDGDFDEGDSITAVLWGFFWPVTYPMTVVFFVVIILSKVFNAISENIYNTFK